MLFDSFSGRTDREEFGCPRSSRNQWVGRSVTYEEETESGTSHHSLHSEEPKGLRNLFKGGDNKPANVARRGLCFRYAKLGQPVVG